MEGLGDDGEEPSPSDPTSQASSSAASGSGETGEILKGMLPVVDGLLQDIETLQLLSSHFRQ